MDDCIFCRIVAGSLPSERVYEDEHVVCFRDLHPVAPVHVLIVPRAHSENLDALIRDDADSPLAAAILRAASRIAEQEGLGAGYRLISNIGVEGGQTVMHTHVHLIGGEALPAKLI